jgi:hypothetical protein
LSWATYSGKKYKKKLSKGLIVMGDLPR